MKRPAAGAAFAANEEHEEVEEEWADEEEEEEGSFPEGEEEENQEEDEVEEKVEEEVEEEEMEEEVEEVEEEGLPHTSSFEAGGVTIDVKAWRRRCEFMAAVSVRQPGQKWRQILSLKDSHWTNISGDGNKALHSDAAAKACLGWSSRQIKCILWSSRQFVHLIVTLDLHLLTCGHRVSLSASCHTGLGIRCMDSSALS